MKTIQPTPGMTITENTRFEPGVYILEEGITLAADGITLDGAGALLIGVNHQGVGVRMEGVRDITIRNLQISGFYPWDSSHRLSKYAGQTLPDHRHG